MQATITLPTQLHSFPQKLYKINKTVYWDEKDKQFYKISLIDPLTMFVRQDLVTRQNIILTKYNPLYLALYQLAQSNVIAVKQIPPFLDLSMFQPFADIQTNQQIRANKNKIMEFIEKRIDNLIAVIDQKQYNKTVRKLTFVNNAAQNKKIICTQIIDLLRKDIPQKYLDQILITKYHQNKLKNIVMDNFVEQLDKQDEKQKRNNKKKPTPKPKVQQPLPKNQPTLFQFSAKKQAKQV